MYSKFEYFKQYTWQYWSGVILLFILYFVIETACDSLPLLHSCKVEEGIPDSGT